MEHMTENDRIMIAGFLDSGMEVKEIARMLNRNRTTICREVNGRRRMTVESRSAEPSDEVYFGPSRRRDLAGAINLTPVAATHAGMRQNLDLVGITVEQAVVVRENTLLVP